MFFCNPPLKRCESDVVSTLSDRHKNWTDAECQTLLKAYERHGENWDTVASCVRGRSKKECMDEIKDLWVVQKFVDHRPSSKEKGFWLLRTRWVMWSAEYDTWEPIVEKYEEVPHLVEQYIKLNPDVRFRTALKRKRDIGEDDTTSNNKISKRTNRVDDGTLQRKIKVDATSEYDEGSAALTCVNSQDGGFVPWTEEEITVLVSLKDREEHWIQIAEEIAKVGHRRSVSACQQKFYYLSEKDKKFSPSGSIKDHCKRHFWTCEELEALVLSKEREEGWRKISDNVRRVGFERSIDSCKKKLYKLSEQEKEQIVSGIKTFSTDEYQTEKRHFWTEEELQTLVFAVDREENWQQISEAVGKVGFGRSIAACQAKLSKYKMKHLRQCNNAKFSSPSMSDQCSKVLTLIHRALLYPFQRFFGLFIPKD